MSNPWRNRKNIKKNAKTYLMCHKVLWNLIIKLIEEWKPNSLSHYAIANQFYLKNFKKEAWNIIFHEDINIYCNCFGCEWSKNKIEYFSDNKCSFCLFKVKNAHYGKQCLDGNWKHFTQASTQTVAIIYAKLIRDFPTR